MTSRRCSSADGPCVLATGPLAAQGCHAGRTERPAASILSVFLRPFRRAERTRATRARRKGTTFQYRLLKKPKYQIEVPRRRVSLQYRVRGWDQSRTRRLVSVPLCGHSCMCGTGNARYRTGTLYYFKYLLRIILMQIGVFDPALGLAGGPLAKSYGARKLSPRPNG